VKSLNPRCLGAIKLTMVEWITSATPVAYPQAVAFMEERVEAIRAGRAAETVWLLEHPPLYTAGTSANAADLRWADRFPVYKTGRGGQFTYHGPGQRVAYVMLDLKARGPDLRAYVYALEEWIVRALAQFGIRGERRCGRVGIWVDRGGGREDKIAAIGVRVRRWVTFHGIAINLDPDLKNFEGIVACGIADPRYGVTSMRALGADADLVRLDEALRDCFPEVFPEPAPARDHPAHAL